MKLSQLIEQLGQVEQLEFQLFQGAKIPSHVHITELGNAVRNYVDCGGKVRTEHHIRFQLWVAEDTDHRLSPQKFLDIIEKTSQLIELYDAELEVEYQQGSIGKFGLDFDGKAFVLTQMHTDCLAKETCGVAEPEAEHNTGCTPGSGCC